MLVFLASAAIIIFLLYPYYSIPDISKSIEDLTKEVRALKDEIHKAMREDRRINDDR